MADVTIQLDRRPTRDDCDAIAAAYLPEGFNYDSFESGPSYYTYRMGGRKIVFSIRQDNQINISDYAWRPYIRLLGHSKKTIEFALNNHLPLNSQETRETRARLMESDNVAVIVLPEAATEYTIQAVKEALLGSNWSTHKKEDVTKPNDIIRSVGRVIDSEDGRTRAAVLLFFPTSPSERKKPYENTHFIMIRSKDVAFIARIKLYKEAFLKNLSTLEAAIEAKDAAARRAALGAFEKDRPRSPGRSTTLRRRR